MLECPQSAIFLYASELLRNQGFSKKLFVEKKLGKNYVGDHTWNLQIELNRKREAELAKLKEEYENGALNHESALANLRQKHNAVIGDLSDQIDALNKAKAK